MSNITVINLSEAWTECCICEKETPLTHSVGYCCEPTTEEVGSESTKYPGHEVGGMPACKECHDSLYGKEACEWTPTT